MTGLAGRQWRCVVCGYIHEGPEPPDLCPVCGAPAEQFEVYVAEPLGATVAPSGGGSGQLRRAVIVGAGIAGLTAAESLRAAAPQAEITLVSSEPGLPYYRLNLTRYLAGEIGEGELWVHPAAWYEERGIGLLSGATVQALDAEGRRVSLDDGRRLDYDKLILAAGAHAFVPPIDGSGLAGVAVLRSLADAWAILDACHSGVRCVCIGGGILGLETAGALARRGAQVTVLESHGWLLPRQLDPRAGQILAARIADMGIRTRFGAVTRRIRGDGHVRGVELEAGGELPADLVVITTGIRSNTLLARQAGLAVGQGVIVDQRLTTSRPDILAAGDVAEHQGIVYGLWGPALDQGRIAGLNAAGRETLFAGVARSNTLKVLGIEMFSIGRIEADDAADTVLAEERDGLYCRLLVRDGLLHGAILLGEAGAAGALKQALDLRRDLSASLRARPGAWELVRALSSRPGA